MRVVEELTKTLHELMARDRELILLGEDVLDPYGGAFKVSRELSERFPDRVRTTPISEAGLVGFAIGVAMRGHPVIAEIMFGDFLTLCADQLINHASKIPWMYNDAVSVPLIVRTPMGGRRGYGPTHSQSLEKHFCGVPGLNVFAVNQYNSPGALLRQAYELRQPVLFIENKTLYAKQIDVPRVPPVSPDIVLAGYGGSVEICYKAAKLLDEREEISAEVVAIEKLWPFDGAALLRAGERCGVVLAVEEGPVGWGFGAACAESLLTGGVAGLCFDTIGAPSHPIPNSRAWELNILPNEDAVAARAVDLLTRRLKPTRAS
jgi:pyruvate/2-oxoglutarate/acetoin dehydrogenase E1 component